MIAQKRNLKRETRFTLLRRDYTGNPRLEKKMPLTRRFLFCARGIITTAWLSYLRIERFLRNRRNPLRICRRPMAAMRPWYNNHSVVIIPAHRAVSAEPEKSAAHLPKAHGRTAAMV